MAIGLTSTFTQQISSGGPTGQVAGLSFLLGRVTHIVYGPYFPGSTLPDPNYKNPTDLGKILFQVLGSVQSSTSNSQGNQLAKPFYSAMKQYPLQGEFVYVVAGPGLALNDDTGQKDYYYLPPFNLWGSSHHNALPNLNDYGDYIKAVQKNYQESQGTNQPSSLTTGSIQYPLGNDFYEKDNLKVLEMFVGDVAFEGRWGNSIRFGSSLSTNKDKNYWYNGPEGNPITILRNGQGRQVDQEGWIPTVENINRDPTSIYLTNGQIIIVDDIQNNFSLASLDTILTTEVTVTIPLNQQLTSMDSLSPNTQDSKINNENPSRITEPSVANSATTVPQSTSTTPTITVVGDYQDVFGSYVVSLRAVNESGTILASVSATGSDLNNTYADAVNQLKGRTPNQTLSIPSVTKLNTR